MDPGALEVLCSIGMTADEATALLQKTKSPGLSAQSIASVCETLTDVAGIPILQLSVVLSEVPELLVTGGPAIERRYEDLLSAWPSERQLQVALRTTPSMLSDAFFTSLQRCMSSLADLGFSHSQTAAAVVREPAIATLRRYEIVNSLKRSGVDLSTKDPDVFEFLSKEPQCMMPQSCDTFKALIDTLVDAGMSRAAAIKAVADCPKLLAVPLGGIQRRLRILQSWGFSKGEVASVVTGWPSVFRLRSKRLRLTLELLKKYNIPAARVTEYPRVFIHNPLRVVGPRLAYLSEHDPKSLELSLTSLLSKGDPEFVRYRVKDSSTDMYEQFRIRWLVQYQQAAKEKAAAKARKRQAQKNKHTNIKGALNS